jgi:hypothetical protein
VVNAGAVSAGLTTANAGPSNVVKARYYRRHYSRRHYRHHYRHCWTVRVHTWGHHWRYVRRCGWR